MKDKEIEFQALLVEIEGMKAENRQRELNGLSLAYVEDSFQIMARKIRDLKFAIEKLNECPICSTEGYIGDGTGNDCPACGGDNRNLKR